MILMNYRTHVGRKIMLNEFYDEIKNIICIDKTFIRGSQKTSML
jgi:hypothetical protein